MNMQTTINKADGCRVCGGELKEGITLIPRLYGSEDFGGDFGGVGTTMSEGPGDGVPRPCLKCVKCGHSFIPGKANHFT
jgi:hypothetical protein